MPLGDCQIPLVDVTRPKEKTPDRCSKPAITQLTYPQYNYATLNVCQEYAEMIKSYRERKTKVFPVKS